MSCDLFMYSQPKFLIFIYLFILHSIVTDFVSYIQFIVVFFSLCVFVLIIALTIFRNIHANLEHKNSAAINNYSLKIGSKKYKQAVAADNQ